MHHAPGSSAGFPANLMNIMTYWLLWCDVGKLTTDDPISWEKTASSSISSFFFITFHIVLSVVHSLFLPASFTICLFLLSLLSLAFVAFILLSLFPSFPSMPVLYIMNQPCPTPNYNLFQSFILFPPSHSCFTSILQRIRVSCIPVFSLLYFFLPFSVHSASVVNHLLQLHPFIQQRFSHYLFVCKYHSLTNP